MAGVSRKLVPIPLTVVKVYTLNINEVLGEPPGEHLQKPFAYTSLFELRSLLLFMRIATICTKVDHVTVTTFSLLTLGAHAQRGLR